MLLIAGCFDTIPNRFAFGITCPKIGRQAQPPGVLLFSGGFFVYFAGTPPVAPLKGGIMLYCPTSAGSAHRLEGTLGVFLSLLLTGGCFDTNL
ncbi:hypothetical protein DDV96_04065 [Marixanthomonas spongiae]|uniref:Uncharacterized protein n=1 Tax=Marixanthomonas spongiae TaxID=2174845 RepID=A0A2U0I5Q2_9FLAO|nr:hypothetical protein DDV96_04065 [Marixanthomonas spongiae]